MSSDTFQQALSDVLAADPQTQSVCTQAVDANRLAEQLSQHWELVKRWNNRTNLTAIRDDAAAAALHYRDSLEGLRLLTDGPIVDFGSGAGFPGMVLAMARPDWSYTLVEPRRKRVSFLETAVLRLGLNNVRVILGRLEDTPDQHYAAAVTRATFSDSAELAEAQRWLRPGAKLLAYRGAAASAPPEGVASCVRHAYNVAGTAHVIETWTFATSSHK